MQEGSGVALSSAAVAGGGANGGTAKRGQRRWLGALDPAPSRPDLRGAPAAGALAVVRAGAALRLARRTAARPRNGRGPTWQGCSSERARQRPDLLGGDAVLCGLATTTWWCGRGRLVRGAPATPWWYVWGAPCRGAMVAPWWCCWPSELPLRHRSCRGGSGQGLLPQVADHAHQEMRGEVR